MTPCTHAITINLMISLTVVFICTSMKITGYTQYRGSLTLLQLVMFIDFYPAPLKYEDYSTTQTLSYF